MKQIVVLIDFTSTDRATRGHRFHAGRTLDYGTFSDDYVETLEHNKYISLTDIPEETSIFANIEGDAEVSYADEIPNEFITTEPLDGESYVDVTNLEPLDEEHVDEILEEYGIEFPTPEETMPSLVTVSEPHDPTILTPKEIEILLEVIEDSETVDIDITKDEFHVHTTEKVEKSSIEERFIGPLLITLIAIFGAFASGYMTVMGYSSLFPQAGVIVITIIIILELAKFSIASVVLHQKGLDLFHKIILGFFATVLVIMASIGHYGFLSKVYGSSSSVITQSANSEENIDRQLKELQADKNDLKEQIKSVPDDYVTAKRRIYKTVLPKINEVDIKIAKLNAEKDAIIKSSSSSSYQDHNVMAQSAKLLGKSPDEFAGLVIMIFSLVIDPLIIILASASSSMRRHRTKH